MKKWRIKPYGLKFKANDLHWSISAKKEWFVPVVIKSVARSFKEEIDNGIQEYEDQRDEICHSCGIGQPCYDLDDPISGMCPCKERSK